MNINKNVNVKVKFHRAHFTGAPWWIVTVDGSKVGPYYDDYESAKQEAKLIRRGD